jgi:hypothetical protein
MEDSSDLARAQRFGDSIRQIMLESEGRILRVINGYTEPNELAIREADLFYRVSTLETRVMEVEKRLNIPPIGS